MAGVVEEGTQSIAELEAWLIAEVRGSLGTKAQVDVDATFESMGLDSLGAVSIVGALELFLGRDLDPGLLYSYPTIGALAEHLVAGRRPVSIATTRRPPSSAESIAVVGAGCRLPGAEDTGDFWRLLAEGRDAVSTVPADRWDPEAVATATGVAPELLAHGGFLNRIDGFDPEFFGISPFEAAWMDPQQRLLLEVAWEALEDAAIPATSLAGTRAGVWIGICTVDYAHLQYGSSRPSRYTSTGTAMSLAANRLSYALDINGPSVALDTACSSSLVAVHQACQSLSLGEVDIALVGGVNLMLAPEVTASQASLGALSPRGRCRAFDAAADGLVRGEGAVVLVLKRRSDAVAAGDRAPVHLRGSAVNNDGRTNGITAPNGRAQEAVIATALAAAELAPSAVQCVEAHGAGTPLGDPIEARALGSVLGVGRSLGDRCSLGSVKTNLGHLEAAAGIAGLLKVYLALDRRLLPPSLHFEVPNEHIPFDALPLRVQTELGPWPRPDEPLVAGVSAFGFGGTNAHVVLEAA